MKKIVIIPALLLILVPISYVSADYVNPLLQLKEPNIYNDQNLQATAQNLYIIGLNLIELNHQITDTNKKLDKLIDLMDKNSTKKIEAKKSINKCPSCERVK